MLLNSFPDKDTFIKLAEKYNVIPLCVEILADTETPVSLLKKFRKENQPIFLLESVEGGERWGRYSFLGTSARTTVRVYKNLVETETAGEREEIPHNGDPLKVLKEITKKYIPADMPELPRFWSGMTGYLTYEMVSFFEKIENKLPDHKPLACFVIPDELLIFDNVRNSMVGLALCFTEDSDNIEELYERAEEKIKTMLETTGKRIPDPSPRQKGVKLPQAQCSEESFRSSVLKVKEYVKQGDVIQTVISQPFTCQAPSDPVELYRAQRYVNPSPYLYFMDLGETTLVGSSPEVMVRLENGVASLRPIAGTRPRGKNEQEDRALADELLRDEKEKAEHLMLVDLGRNDLGRVAQTGTVQVTDLMTVERYSHVMHLVSNINCDIKEGLDAFDLLKATFPAGTLTGAPKIRAMEIISELEEEPRGPYGGAVGYFSFNGNMDLAITIRTACIEGDKLTVRAGAGIVADSVPETERLETVNKAKAIEKALQLLN